MSNVAGLSLLYNILIYACLVHFKTHSSNDMSTCAPYQVLLRIFNEIIV